MRVVGDDLQTCCRALARPPSQDTLQIRPYKLLGGMNAAIEPPWMDSRRVPRAVRHHALDSPSFRLHLEKRCQAYTDDEGE
ncbi:hypothetical protein XAB3213_300038 [Xanthomonas citri pv. bilvae]|nr:hypothetical protein XAB3213_300038 [Xanthomonas citri pv. bilvae]